MRLVTFEVGNQAARPGALVDEGRSVLALPAPSVLAIVEGGRQALERAAETLRRPPRDGRFALDEVRLLAPIPEPPQMRDFLCFEKHLRQGFEAIAKMRGTEARIPRIWYERPLFYHPNRFNVCGTGADVPWPAYCENLDFELEFGCYIGKPGKDIPKAQARSHIFGYTIFNDFSARDEQTKDMMGQLGPGKGKDFDNSNVMGPCLVTADELDDPYRLEMKVRCIAHVSRSETLRAGEFFGSGTVGNGCGLEHMRFLKTGDVVELEVEGIGILRNRVVRP